MTNNHIFKRIWRQKEQQRRRDAILRQLRSWVPHVLFVTANGTTTRRRLDLQCMQVTRFRQPDFVLYIYRFNLRGVLLCFSSFNTIKWHKMNKVFTSKKIHNFLSKIIRKSLFWIKFSFSFPSTSFFTCFYQCVEQKI